MPIDVWRGPIEVEARTVGELFLFVNPQHERAWLFKLILHNEEVYRWDVRPLPAGHNNPPGCPEGFPRKVRAPEHEHVWIEGIDCNCARPLDGIDPSSHEHMFVEFCKRTKVAFQPGYTPITAQLTI